MSYVVTGATGHLGRLVVQHLLADGVPAADIVATGRRTERLADLAEQGVRVAAVDYGRPETIAAAVEGADVVLLVSGSEVGQRVEQHRAVIEAAKGAGVRRLVYTSAPQADTSPLVLAPEHKATEEILRASGLTFTILRNGWYTENYVGDVQQAAASGEIVAAVGDGRVASAPRDDFAAAAAVVLRTEGHDDAVYELSGDVAWGFDDLAAAASEVLGRPVVFRAVTSEERRAGLLAAGLDEGTAGFVVALDENTRDGLLAGTSGDLARLIGRPTTPLAAALRAALAAA
ncbi:SDR family oxidoreductase [Cellulomonas hominis]|uniref:NAD(P)-dependent oxidoreductase n=1 Tax=Cellulomonas hominis TaxID=156981 RepID=A0A511FFB9_9CELL|nr:SDR family oxidoreductase [Cellulomonas hominis]MBB5472726.1 NAD(P)H dehydrogenase (quinone) [Cellulomonas hominis]MBU5422179.1 SDR family oxidoreductase [Cellulomonas hominis]GEL47946.1 NAD(P)-dependent oxidoreductase [Cellulomonas hominis]